MKSARAAIMKAVKTALDTQFLTDGIDAEVVSVAEENEPLDYVHLGALNELDISDKTDDRSEIDFALTAYSASRDQAEYISSVIQERLTDNNKLTLDSPFAIIAQELDIGFPTAEDIRPSGPAFGSSIRVKYIVNHS